ncbi:MAG: hypothetical protein EA397_16610 [Deltaproteobacteria bacterium]|nr:MAG: hypothetical protein EA397_16610 [Deltaproteobacteria bacterium]
MPPSLSALLAGALLGLAPLDGTPGVVLRLLAIALLALAVRGEPLGDLLRGGAAGILWYGTSLVWFPLTWATFDSVGSPWLAFAGLVALQAIVPALSLAVAGLLRARGMPLGIALALSLPSVGILAEWIQPLPAGLEVYLAGDALLLWPAALGGEALLLAVLGMWAGAWQRSWMGLLVSALWIGGGLLAPRFLPAGDPVQVALIQPNTGPLDGRRASTAEDRADRLLAAIQAAGKKGATLVFTPEGAWPHDAGAAGSHRRDRLLHRFEDLPPTVLGVNLTEGDLPTNSLLAVEGGSVTGRYDKHNLIPLGERALLGFGRDTYAAGSARPPLVLAQIPLAGRICYEDLLGSRLASLGSAELLLTPSNDAWLGPGAGSRAHENASRLAALTTGRWVLRPTTNGRTAVFDPLGRRVVHLDWVQGDRSPPPDPEIAIARVDRRAPRWTGADVSGWLALLAAGLALGLSLRRSPSPSAGSEE